MIMKSPKVIKTDVMHGLQNMVKVALPSQFFTFFAMIYLFAIIKVIQIIQFNFCCKLDWGTLIILSSNANIISVSTKEI